MSDDAVEMKPHIVELDTELMNRFKSLYPQRGAFTWFVRSALIKFLALHDTSSDELIAQAITEITIKHSE